MIRLPPLRGWPAAAGAVEAGLAAAVGAAGAAVGGALALGAAGPHAATSPLATAPPASASIPRNIVRRDTSRSISIFGTLPSPSRLTRCPLAGGRPILTDASVRPQIALAWRG